jgi:hypothetical protein
VRRFVERTCSKSIAKYVACFGWEALRLVVARGAKDVSSAEWQELGVMFTSRMVDETLGRVQHGDGVSGGRLKRVPGREVEEAEGVETVAIATGGESG